MFNCDPNNPSVVEIPSNEYIGNSLVTINDNFTVLSEGICESVIDITDIQEKNTKLATDLDTLSASLIPGMAKAWVNFNANVNINGVNNSLGGDRKIYGSYNISSVTKDSGEPGLFIVNFASNLFTNNKYGVIGTCSRTESSGNYVWVQPGQDIGEYTSKYVYIYIKSVNDAYTANPAYVSVLII
jgi:hypothetical protein